MTYPHRYDHHRGALRVCRCGDSWHADYGDEPQVDDCPAALRARVEELERHVGSTIKAQAHGYHHGWREATAACVAYLRARAAQHREEMERERDPRDFYSRVGAEVDARLSADIFEAGKHAPEPVPPPLPPVERERAACVAFLRHCLGEASTYAAAIEAGKHREGG